MTTTTSRAALTHDVWAQMTPIIVTLRDAMELYGDGTDRPQIHVIDEFDETGYVRLELFSSEIGQILYNYRFAGDGYELVAMQEIIDALRPHAEHAGFDLKAPVTIAYNANVDAAYVEQHRLAQQRVQTQPPRRGFASIMTSTEIVGCDGHEVSVSINASLDEGPVIKIEDEQDDPSFGTIYAPTIMADEARVILEQLPAALTDTDSVDRLWCITGLEYLAQDRCRYDAAIAAAEAAEAAEARFTARADTARQPGLGARDRSDPRRRHRR